MTSSAFQTSSVSCYGGSDGSASVSVSSGSPPYSYTWSPSGGNSASATGLSAGVYTVTVGDAVNCLTTATVQITSPPVLNAVVNTQPVSCSAPGSATVNVSGG